MKLLTKLNIRYILFSLIVMLISGIAIYLILSYVINRQMDERLSENLQQVENQINQNSNDIFLDPLVEVEKTNKPLFAPVFSDTLVYNIEEQESEDYRRICAIKKLNGKNYRITILKSKIESEDLLETLALVTVTAMLLLTIILILVNRSVARSVWLPFYNNLKIIGQFSVNDKKPVLLEKSDILEFSELNSVITELSKKIISDFQNQKQFSEDVSHELQTPLAIISSRIETLLNDTSLNSVHADTIKSIYESVRRLSKLNSSLILLNKIENNQFSGNEKAKLKNVVKEKLDEFSELIKLKNLNLEFSASSDFIVNADPALAGILINNLLSNCLNHTPEGGLIKISISSDFLTFCNSGVSAIPDPEKLFDRFYKADPFSGSIGLGLAIVKKICDLNQLGIHYSYSEHFHCFSLS